MAKSFDEHWEYVKSQGINKNYRQETWDAIKAGTTNSVRSFKPRGVGRAPKTEKTTGQPDTVKIGET